MTRLRPAGQLALTPGRPMNEAQLQRHVIAQARDLGWGITLAKRRSMLEQVTRYGVEAPPLDGLVFHPRYSLGSEPGWPDLFMARRRDRRVLLVELKAEKGRLSDRQEEVIELLRHVGLDVRIWRPSDLVSGAIEEALR